MGRSGSGVGRVSPVADDSLDTAALIETITALEAQAAGLAIAIAGITPRETYTRPRPKRHEFVLNDAFATARSTLYHLQEARWALGRSAEITARKEIHDVTGHDGDTDRGGDR